MRKLIPPLLALVLSSTCQADPEYHKELIEREARKQGVDPVLALAVASQESFNTLKANVTRYEKKVQRDYKCSRSDATSYGIFQILPVFHKDRCKIKKNIQLLNPVFNVRCGIKYLAYCTNKENSFSKAMKCWNGSVKYADKIRKQLIRLSEG